MGLCRHTDPLFSVVFMLSFDREGFGVAMVLGCPKKAHSTHGKGVGWGGIHDGTHGLVIVHWIASRYLRRFVGTVSYLSGAPAH